MPNEVADRYVTIYLESRSFDDANEWAKQIALQSGDFTADHVRRILTNVAKNGQVLGSFQIGPLINSLRTRKKLPEAEFETLLMENGLERHASQPARQD